MASQGAHVCVARSQIGVLPPHCVFEVHATHAPLVASQTRPVAQSVSIAQAPQSPVTVLQTGVGLEQSELPRQVRQRPSVAQSNPLLQRLVDVSHGTHAFVVRSQIGVVPLHWASVVQATHVPALTLQTAPDEHSESCVQGAQANVFGSQNGVVAGH